MSLNQQNPLNARTPEAIEYDELLVQSAQNFLIGLGLVAQHARKQGLVFESRGSDDDKLVYVATPAGNTGLVRVSHAQNRLGYSLWSPVRGGIYSRNNTVYYETIEAAVDGSRIIVNRNPYPGENTVLPRRVEVDDIYKSRMLELLVTDMQPIGQREFSQLLEVNIKSERAVREKSAGSKMARFFGRKR